MSVTFPEIRDKMIYIKISSEQRMLLLNYLGFYTAFNKFIVYSVTYVASALAQSYQSLSQVR